MKCHDFTRVLYILYIPIIANNSQYVRYFLQFCIILSLLIMNDDDCDEILLNKLKCIFINGKLIANISLFSHSNMNV